jgi:hypothetical protein
MRKLFVHLFVTAITFFFGLGLCKLFDSSARTAEPVAIQTVQLANSADVAVEQTLREVYREYGPATTNHDRAFFERVESNRFILFDEDRNLTREQDIREMESWPRDAIYELEVENIRIIGDSAVAYVRVHARFANGEYESWPSIDVWIKDGNRWQILSTTVVE